MSLLEVVQTHHKVVIEALTGLEGPQELAAAATFLVEILAPFEMARRAFRDSPGPTG